MVRALSYSMDQSHFRTERSSCWINLRQSSYFPAQNGSDNLKEGFEIGPPDLAPQPLNSLANISLTEANVWPEKPWINIRPSVETLHRELQTLSVRVLSLLAVFLNRPPDYFASFSKESVSTLRFLHYPAIIPPSPQQELCCTPHTDSGILTLLHQDSTGGLEVLTAGGAWIDTPYVPGSIVINAGDLMAKVSGGKFKATCHRVRSIPGKDRYSVPFFFEPGVDCLLTSIDSEEEEDISYGQHVLEKMEGWIEFRDLEKDEAIVEAVEEIEEGVEL